MAWGYGIGNPILYWIIRVILLCILTFCGFGIGRYPKQSKKFTYIAALFYSLIQGLRWLRGIDYAHYYNDIVSLFGKFSGQIGHGITPNPEPLYKLWVYIFHYTGLPFYFAFIAYSLFLITPILLIAKKYKEIAVYLLPIFYLITCTSSENLVRQYFALAFLEFAYVAYLYNKRVWMYISLICVPLIHISGLFGVLIFLIFTHINVKIKKPYIFILLLILTTFFWKDKYFLSISDLLQNITIDDTSKMSGYIESADIWFTNEKNVSENISSNLSIYIRFSFFLILTYVGFYTQLKKKEFQCIYYMAYIAMLLYTVGNNIEIYRRFYNWLIFTIPILTALVIKVLPKYKWKKIAYIVIAVYIFYYQFISSMFINFASGYGFIWDK